MRPRAWASTIEHGPPEIQVRECTEKIMNEKIMNEDV